MLQFFHGTNIPFMKYRRMAYFFSGALVLATALWLVVKGPRYGVDFTGGTLLTLRTSQVIHADEMRNALDAAGLKGFELQQGSGTDATQYMLRIPTTEQKDVFNVVKQSVESRFSGTTIELRSNEVVGPKVGNELRQKAVWAILTSLTAILVFVGIRYEFKFAFGAVIALFHDVFVTLGVLMFFGREMTLTVVAALLTIAGFSINDTIVIFDRIRERSKELRKEKHSRVMDIAVNETLARTFITSLTVFLTAVALFIWGGEVLRDFSLAMLVGVAFGTYSSVFVASALALDTWIGIDRRKGINAE